MTTAESAARLERSSFLRNEVEQKKAGVEGGNVCPKEKYKKTSHR